MGNLPAIDYDRMEADRLAAHDDELQKELQARVSSGGAHNSLRRVVLHSVTDGNYELAQSEIDDYISYRAQFPNFQSRCERYREHCRDLVDAIKTKRTFPGLKTLSISKQQELHDKVIEHFEELKGYLKQIEMVEREVRMEDLRSTTWFIRTVAQCVLAIFGVGLVLDLTGGMASSFVIVINRLVSDLSTWLANLF